MAKVHGVCKNIDDCTKAEKREVQELERSASFVCEECKKPLTEVKSSGGKSKKDGKIDGKSKLPLIIGIILCVLVLAAGIYFLVPFGDSEVISENPPEETEVEEVAEIPESLPGNQPYVVIEEGNTDTGNGKGTISFDYGKYTGDIKNFKANGSGTLVFYKQYRLSQYDKQNRMAEARDYFVGEFKDNEPTQGKWFNENKEQKGAVITGQLGIPE